MKIFLDTANVEHIKIANSWGVLDGVTTNPTLLAKEGRPFLEAAKEILGLVRGPVSLEVTTNDYLDMVAQGRELAKLADNVVVKVQMTPEGLRAVRALHEEEIKVNVTLIFSATQAILAAKAGASFVSPFIGRLDDIGQEGMQVIREIVPIFQNYQYDCEVLVASIRHPLHVVEAGLIGADICTMPFEVLEKMTKHALTDVGLKRFFEDWKRVPR